MEFFLLMAIGPGQLTTFYDLQKKLALQPGGIRPAIIRLEREGLVKRAVPGRRRRREYRLTWEGEEVLINRWKESLKFNLDLKETIRVACIALKMGTVETCRQYLSKAASIAASKANSLAEQAKRPKSTDFFATYLWMRFVCESHKWKGEQIGMEEVCRSLDSSSSNDTCTYK